MYRNVNGQEKGKHQQRDIRVEYNWNYNLQRAGSQMRSPKQTYLSPLQRILPHR